MDANHIIEPERQGLWIAVTFIIALLALGLSFVSMQRMNAILVGTQAEAVSLNSKIEKLRNEKAGTSAPVAQAPAPSPASK